MEQVSTKEKDVIQHNLVQSVVPVYYGRLCVYYKEDWMCDLLNLLSRMCNSNKRYRFTGECIEWYTR